MDEAAQDAALARIGLTDLWGVAGRLAACLAAIGIDTPLDLKRGDPRLIRERLGIVTMRLALELRGVPCLDLERDVPDRKNIMASRSFGRPVTRLAELREAVASYTARAAEKLRRRQHLATAHLMVFVETNRFKPDEAQHHAARTIHLPVATSDTGKLIGVSLAGLKSIWRHGYRYKKAGVMLLDLHPASTVQEGLFDKADSNRLRPPRHAAIRLSSSQGESREDRTRARDAVETSRNNALTTSVLRRQRLITISRGTVISAT